MATEEEWVCLRKRRYRRRRSAIKAARAAQSSYGRMQVYRCPFGGNTPHYHVGHPPRYASRTGAPPAGR